MTVQATRYAAGVDVDAYVELISVGDPLPDMPPFLDPRWYVNVPIEATYWPGKCPNLWHDQAAPRIADIVAFSAAELKVQSAQIARLDPRESQGMSVAQPSHGES